ncbi:MAG TPA: HNH endonuclease [Opitutaceae bacterium]
MRFWWVSQNQTYRQETEGGYLWSPKHNRDGGYNPYYEFMREIAPGDLVFSFSDTWIRKLGIAQGYCFECPRPLEFGAAGRAWNDIGWRINIRFSPIRHSVRPRDHINVLRPLLPSRHSPLQSNGNGNQMYLAAVPEPMAGTIGNLIGDEYKQLMALAYQIPTDKISLGATEKQEIEHWEEHIVEEISQAPYLNTTEREAIIQARVGQGLFRQNLARIETHCRVTRITEPTHLRASHTKPWRTSSDVERVNGENGFLLTPSIDHLFDRGFISFEDNGELIISPVANRGSLERMGVPCDRVSNVGSFSVGQQHFLSYHRDNVFLKQRTIA